MVRSRSYGTARTLVATYGRPGSCRTPQRQCRPSGVVPGGPRGGRPRGSDIGPQEGPGRPRRGPGGPPGRDSRGPKKADFRPFSDPCDAKSRGSGGAPPTHLILLRNQWTASRIAAARTAPDRPSGGRRAAGAVGGGGGVLGCVASGGVATRGWREQGHVLAEREAHLRGPQAPPAASGTCGHPPLPGLLGGP